MPLKIAIIGGGPAGSLCAYHLARAGHNVSLYERDMDREKPCGGGLTLRALKTLPNLYQLDIDLTEVRRFCLISPGGRTIELNLNDPILIVSRHQLDGALRQQAVTAGTTLIRQKVVKPRQGSNGKWQVHDDPFDIVVGASGINDPIARLKGLGFLPDQRGHALGYFVPGLFPPSIVCRFFPGRWGYAWWFPRPDHASLGIELMGGSFTPQLARKLIHRFIREDLGPYLSIKKAISLLDHATPYTWAEPLLSAHLLTQRRLGGRTWIVVGDAAGLVDSLTGEGLPYALLSGKLAAKAICKGRPESYTAMVAKQILPELKLASRMSPVFYSSLHLRTSLFVLAKSHAMQAVTKDMALGHLKYRGFKKRMIRDAPQIVAEMGGYFVKCLFEKLFGDRYAY